jgi:hypothetical protein
MIFYSWSKIRRKAGNSSKRVITILEAMLANGMPRSRYDPIYSYYYEDFAGHSFLKNPEYLLQFRYKWRDKEIADYIGLASFRNFGEYKVNGKVTLDLALSPLGQDAINNNRLLRIDRNEIHFLYEDYTGEHTWQV